MNSTERVRKHFDKDAQRFDAIYESDKPLHQRLGDALFRRVILERFSLVVNAACAPGKTVLESDNHLFTLLTLNTHPLHFDAEYGKATEFGQNLVVSNYTLALLIGMSVSGVAVPKAARMLPVAP